MSPRALIAVLVCGACFAPARAEPLGRLFHSSAERSALDALRKEKAQPPKPAAPPPTADRPTADRPAPRLEGYVMRSDGRSTLWVNGSAVAGPR